MSVSGGSRRRSSSRMRHPAAPVRPTTPTILFENMNGHARETYAKSLLLRQQASRQPKPQELWREDPTLYARPAPSRLHETVEPERSGWSAQSSRSDLPSASRGTRPAPLDSSGRSFVSAADVSTSFVVAETGDERSVSRGGTAISYGTAPTTSHVEHRHDTGEYSYYTGTLEQGPPAEPAPALPFPVLWQLQAQSASELPGGLQPIGGTTAIEDALGMARELRNLRKRGGGAAAQAGESTKKNATHADKVVRQVRESRHRAARAVLQAKQRERLAGGKPRLKAHSYDPGAETRPVPKAGRRAQLPPGEQPRDVPPGPIKWDGQDAVLPSGPRAPLGHSIPLQYLELVRMEDQVGGGLEAGGSDGVGGGAFGPLALAKPGMRYAGGGFAKSRPGKVHTEEDYVELLRVAEVLEALNAVEGAVLHEQPDMSGAGTSGAVGQPQDLLSYEEYLASVMANVSKPPDAAPEDPDAPPITVPAAVPELGAPELGPEPEPQPTDTAQELVSAAAVPAKGESERVQEAVEAAGDDEADLRGATSGGSLPPTI